MRLAVQLVCTLKRLQIDTLRNQQIIDKVLSIYASILHIQIGSRLVTCQMGPTPESPKPQHRSGGGGSKLAPLRAQTHIYLASNPSKSYILYSSLRPLNLSML